MTREPHIHTPAHDPARTFQSSAELLKDRRDPGRPDMGSPDWWRRNVPKKPDWWDRIFSQPWEARDDLP